jgi:hypothetical protein
MAIAGATSVERAIGPIGVGLVAVYGICALTLAIRRRDEAPAWLVLSLPLYFTYKSAITRCDIYHAQWAFAAAACLIASLTLATTGRRQAGLAAAALALAVVGLVMARPDPLETPKNFGRVLAWPWLFSRYEAKREARLAPDGVAPELMATIGRSTVDVFPHETAMIVANGLTWRPRYAFQSYFVCRPALDALNAADYRAENAPDFVLYRHESADDWSPFLLDPQSLDALRTGYRPVMDDGTTVLLKRRAVPLDTGRTSAGSTNASFGQLVELPGHGQEDLVLAHITFRMRPWGPILASLYRVVPPTMRVFYADGSSSVHHVTWRNAVAGFPVSSVPRNLVEARQFFEGRFDVASVRAIEFQGNSWAFMPEVAIRWSRVPKVERPETDGAGVVPIRSRDPHPRLQPAGR